MMKPSSIKKASQKQIKPKLPSKETKPLASTSINSNKKTQTDIKKQDSIKKPTISSVKTINKTVNGKVSSTKVIKKEEQKIIQKITQPSKVVQQKFGYKGSVFKNNKVKEIKGQGWGFISFDNFLTICQYYCTNAYDIYFLSTICHGWKFYLQLEEGKYCWQHLKDCEKVDAFAGIKKTLQQNLGKIRQKMAVQYEKHFTKLFNYGSTKQNVPNKLVQKLNLQISLNLNKKLTLKQIPFRLRTYNFSSYLCFKVTDIQDWKYDFYSPHNMFKDKLNIDIKFYSKRYKVFHQIKYQFLPEDVVQCAIKQKAFNYFLEKNLILTFFQGDDHFLYFFFEISALELVNIFRDSIKESQKQIIDSAMRKVPMYKKLAETQFQSFIQYLKYQADFQLHMSYHNSVKQIFTFCDTKVYPVQYDQKKAFFKVSIDDTFPKVDTYKLDNKMGISQAIQNLYLLDLTLKDRDKFLLNFSGFIFARKADQKERQSIENYFNFAQNEMKILEFKSKKYQFRILIIEQLKKNLIKEISLTYYA